MTNGRVHVYTGDGKGKTSAAIGLTVRAVGSGLRVFIGRFLKRHASGEITALESRFPEVVARSFGAGRFVRGKPSAKDLKCARAGLAELTDRMARGGFDVVVADEINNAVSLGLLSETDVLDLLDRRPRNVELILTGRDAGKRILARADLVTEMRKVKHYYDAGIRARRGIET